MSETQKKSGFFDLPKKKTCNHPEHNPPTHLHIPQGQGYIHICPGCKKEKVIVPPQFSLERKKISSISNCDKKEVFFTTDHCQPHGLGDSWVSCTHTLPLKVVKRDELPSGIITNKEELIKVLYNDHKVINNPNPEYQA